MIATPDNDTTDSQALVLFFEGRILLNENSPFWPADLLTGFQDCVQTCLHVPPLAPGQIACQAIQFSELPLSLLHLEPMPVRQFLLQQGFDAFILAGRASQLLNWYQMHRYCGACGNKNVLAHGVQPGQQLLRCNDCQTDYYPRINPCVIVLITRGNNILLAKSIRRGATFYSCLAGFIEPGESAEEAVAREVLEEVGIRVNNIRYVKSQPWPFPSQLMLGFYADYVSGDITPDPAELAEADWYNVNDLPDTPAPGISVAGQLIREYCDAAMASTDFHEER